MIQTAHHFAMVNGRKVFYREAGDASLPAIILLHGFPSSSFMFRGLIPLLAEKFHVIAPDYIGFGQSDAPSVDDFDYTFDSLTTHVTGLITQLGLKSYVLYMQDYGGPIGFRIFTSRPEAVKGFIIQNANAYMEGVGDLPKQVFLPLWKKRDADSEVGARTFLAAGTTEFQYTVGAKNPAAISPDNWTLDQALLDRPGTDAYQLDLLENYKTNVALYDIWHAAFRKHQPKTLILWGKHDPFFIEAGATAFLADLPKARLVWLDAGHFVLDENTAIVAAEIKADFALPMTTATEIVRRFYAALGQGDAPAALGLMADDIEWNTMWHYKVDGRGPQKVAEGLLAPLMAEWTSFALTPSAYITEGNTVVSLGSFHGVHSGTDKSVNAAYAHIWDIVGGKIQRFRQYIDTLAVAEARQ